MEVCVNALQGYAVHASDGDLGRVDGFLLDDRYWTIRYLVVETGSWLVERKVLIAPTALESIDPSNRRILVKLTREQVRHSPDIDTDQPVSRQHEAELMSYFGWPAYWDDWAGSPLFVEPRRLVEVPPGDPHLRSTGEISGYRIHASDGEIGHVEDFLLDEGKWSLRSLVVSTRNWLPGKKVVLPVAWVRDASWENAEVTVDHTRAEVLNCPVFDDGHVFGW